MNTIFVGGSRRVSQLPALARARIENVLDNGDMIIVGDAAGADKATQKLLCDVGYQKVTVFCSGSAPRNNLGAWPVERVSVARSAKGFQFYAAKDREMARRADFGLMVWDGKSVGTLLNVLRLLRAGKKAVLVNGSAGHTSTMKSVGDWVDLIRSLDGTLVAEMREKATRDEWIDADLEPYVVPAPLDAPPPATPATMAEPPSVQRQPADLGEALAANDSAAVLRSLSELAMARGIDLIAKHAGLACETLIRVLDPDRNPDFATVMRIVKALDLRMKASPIAKPRRTTRKAGARTKKTPSSQPDLITAALCSRS